MYREPFLMIIFLFDTVFYRKPLELTKNYHQKLITPNRLKLILKQRR
jgi:hypothetical protein